MRGDHAALPAEAPRLRISRVVRQNQRVFAFRIPPMAMQHARQRLRDDMRLRLLREDHPRQEAHFLFIAAEAVGRHQRAVEQEILVVMVEFRRIDDELIDVAVLRLRIDGGTQMAHHRLAAPHDRPRHFHEELVRIQAVPILFLRPFVFRRPFRIPWGDAVRMRVSAEQCE